MAQQNFQVDLSELEGRRFTCLDGCGLCCLCQPELLDSEVPYFRRNYQERIVAKRQPHRHFALAMKKKVGSCSFLNQRRCEVYSMRPHYCRQFPYHIYIGNRVQVELDLSCRGVWMNKGEDCMTAGVQMVEENRDAIAATFESSNQIYRQFFKNCLEMEVDCQPIELRKETESVLDRYGDINFLAALLEASAEDEKVDARSIRPPELDGKRKKELEEAAVEAARDSLGAADPFDAPIHCAEDGTWNVFRYEDDAIERYVISEQGDLDHVQSLDLDDIKLTEPTEDGRREIISYIRMLNKRDSLMGNAFHLMDDYGYEDYMANIYHGVLATSALEMLWRSVLVSKVYDLKLDARGVREGIIYYDMDRLDAPTIGAFI